MPSANPPLPSYYHQLNPPRTAPTVLLVDENAAVRSLLGHILRAAEYEVLEASDARSALALANLHPGPIDLLVLDTSLEGSSPRDVSQRFGVLRPGVPVIYLSGYPLEILQELTWWEPGWTLLEKPFLPGDLRAAVQEALEANPHT